MMQTLQTATILYCWIIYITAAVYLTEYCATWAIAWFFRIWTFSFDASHEMIR